MNGKTRQARQGAERLKKKKKNTGKREELMKVMWRRCGGKADRGGTQVTGPG